MSATNNASSLFTRTQTFEYDSGGLGNLTKRTDLLGGSSVNNDVGQINYDRVRNAGIHAVTSAGGINYSYDRYGNMTTRGSETIVYNTFNKPTRIAGASITDFYYDPDHELYKEIRGSKTIYKVAGGRYEVIVEGSTTTQKSYVDGVILNTRTLVNGVQNTDGIAYLHSDHIGSVEATSNALGQFVNRMSFGAWGERQLSNWKPGTPTETFLTGNGFTGHDQLDNHNLIHMGGRVYDPNLGRFLSADLFVQSPYNSQSFNRYSYTFNNPGSFVDPAGYTCTTHYFHHYYHDGNGSRSYQGDTSQQTCDGNDFYNQIDPNNGVEDFNVTLGEQVSIAAQYQQATGIIEPLEGNQFYGAAAILVEDATLGIIWGENGSILPLRTDPQMEANKNAASNGVAGPLIKGAQLAMMVAGSGKLLKGARAEENTVKGGKEIVYRWMSKAELKSTLETGLLRGGREGKHYVTDAANSDPLRARIRSALPQTPEVRVKMEVPGGILSAPSRVQPAFNMPGGGMERTAIGNIPVNILEVF